MSRENVEIVRIVFEAWQSGDFETALSYYSDDATFQTGSVDTTVYRGREGADRAMGEWVGAFRDYWVKPEGLIDAGDTVVFMWREGGVGRASGVPVEEEGAMIFTLEDGKIVSSRGYTDRAAACADAGIPLPD
jgi:ketosteroid isomerase-like protein